MTQSDPPMHAPPLAPVHASTPPQTPDSNEVIREVVKAEGDIYLAAERLNTSREILLSTLAEDTEAASKLAAQLRMLNMVQVFGLINETKDALSQAIHSLRPGEVARTYTSLVSALATLSDKQTLQLLQSVTTNVGIQLVPWAVNPAELIERTTVIEALQKEQSNDNG